MIETLFFRSWSGNSNAVSTIKRTMQQNPKLKVTLPAPVEDESVIEKAISKWKF